MKADRDRQAIAARSRLRQFYAMPVELSELMQLALGQRPYLLVGELPRPVATYLGCNPGLVYLGRNELMKITFKHKEIAREELQCLPHMIKSGRYLTVSDRANCVTIIAAGLATDLLYQCGIKATANGGEVWIQTFHRTTPKKAERKSLSCTTIVGF